MTPAPQPLAFAEIAADSAVWLRPVGFLSGAAAAAALADGTGLALAGTGRVFTFGELLSRRSSGVVAALAPVAALRRRAEAPDAPRLAQQLEALTAPRPAWAGLALDRPRLMGIVNVTPDSFSDGGEFLDPERAIAHGRALRAAGADIIDVGGESTRPGAAPIAPEEETRRILPVVAALAQDGALVSVDTRHAAVMRAALGAGARIVNDVTALGGDAAAAETVAAAGAAAVLMHMQGEPRTMQASPAYRLASLDIVEYLDARLAACAPAGIPRSRLAVDPGIGFGKSLAHNLEILARIALFHATGAAVALGLSRKSLVGRLIGSPVGERLPGSLAGALDAAAHGVQILRVHDVAETRQALAFQEAVLAGA